MLSTGADWLDGLAVYIAVIGVEFEIVSPPELAQRVGLQGMVKLQVRITKDGRVEVLKLLQGEPALADAAITAVKQWRGKPAWVNGKPVEVVSTVTFNFQLK
jgi:protein TonB